MTDNGYLMKLKQAGWSDEKIAQKMGLTAEQVAVRYNALMHAVRIFEQNGYNALVNAFNAALLNYQNLGDRFIPLGHALSNPPQVEELLECYVDGDPSQTMLNLLSKFIILRPFVARPIPPSASSDPAQN
jgi:hypothetical protein